MTLSEIKETIMNCAQDLGDLPIGIVAEVAAGRILEKLNAEVPAPIYNQAAYHPPGPISSERGAEDSPWPPTYKVSFGAATNEYVLSPDGASFKPSGLIELATDATPLPKPSLRGKAPDTSILAKRISAIRSDPSAPSIYVHAEELRELVENYAPDVLKIQKSDQSLDVIVYRSVKERSGSMIATVELMYAPNGSTQLPHIFASESLSAEKELPTEAELDAAMQSIIKQLQSRTDIGPLENRKIVNRGVLSPEMRVGDPGVRSGSV